MKRTTIFFLLLTFGFQLWGQSNSTKIAILNSPQKENVKPAVQKINDLKPTATVFLGDLVSGSENDFLQYVFYLNWLEMPMYALCGNKDFSIFKADPQEAISALMLPSPYYCETATSSDNSLWRLFFLNGSQLSLHAYKKNSIDYKFSKNQKNKLYKKASNDCGGLGEKQLHWLQLELNKAEHNGEKAIIFCRFPLEASQGDTLWDHQELKNILAKFSCVKCYFSDASTAGLCDITKDNEVIVKAYGVPAHKLSDSPAFTTIQLEADKIIISESGNTEAFTVSF